MKFAKWFEKQHGDRYQSGLSGHPDYQLRHMATLGRFAETVLRERALWDEKRTSALYAWNVKDEAKE